LEKKQQIRYQYAIGYRGCIGAATIEYVEAPSAAGQLVV
jgi:hypothetical protein